MANVPAPGVNGTPFSFGVEVLYKQSEKSDNTSTIRGWFNGELVVCIANGGDGGYGVTDVDADAWTMMGTYNGAAVDIDQIQWFDLPGGTVIETEDCTDRSEWENREDGASWTASGGEFHQPGGSGLTTSTIAREQPVGARYMECQGVVFTGDSGDGNHWFMIKLNANPNGLFQGAAWYPHGYGVYIKSTGEIRCFPGDTDADELTCRGGWSIGMVGVG